MALLGIGNKGDLAISLRGLAAATLGQGEARNAACLWGASEALRQSVGVPIPLRERQEYDRQVAQARAALGEDVFAAAWEEGRTLTWEQAAAAALADAGYSAPSRQG